MSSFRFGAAGALSVAALVLALTPPAPAAVHKKQHGAAPAKAAPTAAGTLGTVGAWSAYASADKTGRVCYLVGRPQKSDSAAAARKEPSAMVTHRPAENIANVVSFVEGYPIKEDSEVVLEIGDKKFALFTKDDSAWARTAELDKAIVAALAKGRSAIVKATPQKGRPTTDVYALAGFGRALALIDQACGVKREAAAAKPAAPKAARHAPRPTGSPHR